MYRSAPRGASRQEGTPEYHRHLRSVNREALVVGALLGGGLVPLFWLLDVWVMQRNLTLMLILRGGVGVWSVALLLGMRLAPDRVARHARLLTSAHTIVVASAIAALCWVHGGYESPYYVGLNLAMVGTGLLFVWPLSHAIMVSLIVYAVYMGPLALGVLSINDWRTVVTNQFFLLGTIVIILAAQNYRYRLERRWFFARSDLERTKQSLEEAYQRTMELDRLKSNFFSSVTHELRTPLTMILAPLEALLEDARAAFEPAQREYLHAIRANALRLLKLINDLLDLARLEEKYLRLRVEAVDLPALLTEIVEYSRPLANRKDLTIELEVGPASDEVFVDVEKLERVVVNLLANALKFSEPGGRVWVWLREQPDTVEVGVRDDGPGIEPEAQRYVFERFRQADGSVTRRYGGTGIGLALAKELVELHGGQITLRSEIGVGSEFVVHLRRGRDHFASEALDRRQHPESAPAPRRSEDREPREWNQQLLERPDYRFLDIEQATERRLAPRGDEPRATKLVVVEDNLEILRFLSLQLRDVHSVYLAPDGAKGLELIRREQPDLVITDYMMPGMDGLELIQALKADGATATIPIVMLTARSDVAARLAAREAGADVYLSKPFNPQEVRAAVSRLLERRGQQVAVVAREQVRSLEVISAGLAHEIHNPLSFVANAVHVIGERLAELQAAAARGASQAELTQLVAASHERTERMLEVAGRGIDRIRRVVELVRGYAQAGYPREPSVVAFDDLVREVEPLVIAPPEREIQVECAPAAPTVTVRCIPGEMQQVIRNLWQNALEAVADGGHVRVRTRHEGGGVVLEVEDDGPGMPPAVKARVFTPFFTTKPPGKAMGLGLAITHQMVTRAGGEIGVESEVGRGTVFRVRLPVAERSGATNPESS